MIALGCGCLMAFFGGLLALAVLCACMLSSRQSQQQDQREEGRQRDAID